jgi:hypothetical protein
MEPSEPPSAEVVGTVAAPEPEPPLTVYPAPVHDGPQDLVPAPLQKYAAKRLAEVGVPTLSSLWGKSSQELSFLAGVDSEEVEDTRPWQTLFEDRTGVGEGWRQLKATWSFIDGELFMLRLDFRDRAQKLVEKTQATLGGNPVATLSLRDRTVFRIWHDNGLVVGVEELKGKYALVVADRGRFERHQRRLEGVNEAERLVWASLDQFYSRTPGSVGVALDGNVRAAELVPGFGDAWSNACHAAYQLGQLDDAQAHCAKALEVTKEPSVRGEASYYQGLLSIAHGDKEGGLRLLRRANAEVPRAWGISSDIRLRIAGLEGKATEEVLERAVYDYWCAGHRDGDRQRRVPSEFGFTDYEALRAAADDELVDVEGLQTKAEQKCGQR